MKNIREKFFSFLKVFLAFLFIALIIGYQFSGAIVSDKKAITLLENQGYSEVKIIERDFLFIPLRGGAKDDVVRFKIKAKNPLKKPCTVYVYSGWPLKGATIRSE